MKKHGRAARATLFAASAGVCAAGTLRAFAPWLGFTIKLNAPVFAIAAVLGAPGMVLLLLCRVVFGA